MILAGNHVRRHPERRGGDPRGLARHAALSVPGFGSAGPLRAGPRFGARTSRDVASQTRSAPSSARRCCSATASDLEAEAVAGRSGGRRGRWTTGSALPIWRPKGSRQYPQRRWAWRSPPGSAAPEPAGAPLTLQARARYKLRRRSARRKSTARSRDQRSAGKNSTGSSEPNPRSTSNSTRPPGTSTLPAPALALSAPAQAFT